VRINQLPRKGVKRERSRKQLQKKIKRRPECEKAREREGGSEVPREGGHEPCEGRRKMVGKDKKKTLRHKRCGNDTDPIHEKIRR